MGQSYVRQELDLATWGRPLFLFRGRISNKKRIFRIGIDGSVIHLVGMTPVAYIKDFSVPSDL